MFIRYIIMEPYTNNEIVSHGNDCIFSNWCRATSRRDKRHIVIVRVNKACLYEIGFDRDARQYAIFARKNRLPIVTLSHIASRLAAQNLLDCVNR
jgi:hypothetical protein